MTAANSGERRWECGWKFGQRCVSPHCLLVLILTVSILPSCAQAYYSWMYLGMSGVGGGGSGGGAGGDIAASPHATTRMSADQPYFETAGDLAKSVCAAVPGLVAQQIQVCQVYPSTIESVTSGARRGIRECQWQFRNERWNCTTQPSPPKPSSARALSVPAMMNDDAQVNMFQYTLERGSKETAFVYAITAAGVVHAVTQACSSGTMTECTCDRASHGSSTPQGWKWGGCSDDVQFGINFARQFVDAPERSLKPQDPKKLMNLHNNEAGRLAVQALMKMQCRCHGVSGSCELKTCWRTMPSFTAIGDFLKKRYRKSIEVATKRSRLRRKRRRGRGRRSSRSPRRRELVYLQKSPDYCVYNPKQGILGTSGRPCQKNSPGPDSCDLLCCGRGYHTQVVRKSEKCDCKFVWCCKVYCKTCITLINIYTCK